jgi:hypothetical protein
MSQAKQHRKVRGVESKYYLHQRMFGICQFGLG